MPTEASLPPTARAELLGTALVSALEVGDTDDARGTAARLAALLDDVDDPYLVAVSQLLLGWAATLVDDVPVARARLADALERLRGLDEPMWTALALVAGGSVAALLGDARSAARLLGEARRLAGRFDTPWLDTASRVGLVGAALRRNDVDRARVELTGALDLVGDGGSAHGLALVLQAAAAVAVVTGDPERAGLVTGAMHALRLRAGLRGWAAVRRDDDLVAAIRDAVGPERIGPLLEQGARLDRQAAVELARGTVLVGTAAAR